MAALDVGRAQECLSESPPARSQPRISTRQHVFCGITFPDDAAHLDCCIVIKWMYVKSVTRSGIAEYSQAFVQSK